MKKRRIKKKAFAKLFAFIGILFLSIGGFLLYRIISDDKTKYLLLDLIGEKEITLKLNEEYNDKGATSSFKKENLTEQIEINNDLDIEHPGTYKYTYKIKYNDLVKEIERTIRVVDDEKPTLTLKGRKTITLAETNEYVDPGFTATDNYDGDLTEKVEVDTSKLDMSKVGEYKVVYTVKDTSGNEERTERTINVVKKGSKDQKVPVLNYHFFYEEKDKVAHDDLYVRMDRFNEQLEYLKDNGYYTLTINEFTRWMYNEIEIPEKSVLITIDDGGNGTSLKGEYNYLIPALEKYEMNATLFLITGWWSPKDYKSEYLDIQSHTYNLHYEQHCGFRSKVNCVSYEELLDDLKKSIKAVKNTDSFCFPFYEYTETSIKAVKDAGFRIAFIGMGRKASRNDDKYKIPRYAIHDSTTMEKFKQMVN